jgi:DNA helicase HerA-like ATPase
MSSAMRRLALALLILWSLFSVLTITDVFWPVLPTSDAFVVLVSRIGVLIGLLGSLVAVIAILRAEPPKLQIAIAGRPGAGKTVYVNVLLELLMEDRDETFSFEPEVRTARAVKAAILDLGRGKWPRATPVDGVRTYRGSSMLRRRRWVLPSSRRRIEIGDSAGEYWADLADEGRKSKPRSLIESTFFDYVADSDFVFYFIDAGAMSRRANVVREAVEDLIATAQILRYDSSYVRTRRIRIAVVISKFDLLTRVQADVLSRVLRGEDPDSDQDFASNSFSRSLLSLRRLAEVLESSGQEHQFFFVSAGAAALEAEFGKSLLGVKEDWAPGAADTVIHPFRWALTGRL